MTAFCPIQGVRRSWKSWMRGSPDLNLTCLQHRQPQHHPPRGGQPFVTLPPEAYRSGGFSKQHRAPLLQRG